ncbi:MAG TPA: DUF433 domain-containing protein [Pirellulales bacterium]|nr:DUF433 domain-containing protein [Pirellulales bacterium]
MQAVIIDRGRGPEITGTRITVYDIMDYYTQGWHHTAIAARLRISSRQVIAATEYIESHTEEVLAGYRRILDRDARGNPPEIEAKRAASHAKLQALLVERRGRAAAASDHERDPNGRPKATSDFWRATMIDRGRGPEIAGTRITVYDIMDYYTEGWHHTAIAATLGLSSAQVIAATDYIEAHKDAVQAEYQMMLECDALGNPPELQAKLDATHAKFQALWENRHGKAALESENARDFGR